MRTETANKTTREQEVLLRWARLICRMQDRQNEKCNAGHGPRIEIRDLRIPAQ